MASAKGNDWMAKNKKLQPGDAAPSGVCLTVDEMPVDISSTWAEGPVFLTFLRHFG